MFECINTISELSKLCVQSEQLIKLRNDTSTEEFAAALKDLDTSIDRVNKNIEHQFGSDPDVLQLLFELKSAAIALRACNVESKT